METFLEILEATPWWIYLILFFLILGGIRSLSPRKLPFKQLLILPIILVLWSIISLYNLWNGSWVNFFIWLLFLVIGSILGWIFTRSWKIGANRESGYLFLPGSWTTLVCSLIFFVVKYSLGVYFSIVPEPLEPFLIVDSIVGGIISGYFSGKTYYFWRVYINS